MGQRECRMINQLSTTSHRKLPGAWGHPTSPTLVRQPHIGYCWEAVGCPMLDSTINRNRRANLEGYSFAKTGFFREVRVEMAALQCPGKSCISASCIC